MKQTLLSIVGAAVFIVFVGLFVQKAQKDKGGSIFATPTPKAEKEIFIGSTKIWAEVADTAQKREKGLGGRAELAENKGMLFMFDSKDVFPSFWMKGMKFPIDIIWINDGKIAKIEKSVPIPAKDASEKSLTLYRPDKPIDYALEVNAGFSDNHSLKVGDEVAW
jgi:uncharacterized membrane protein (UPF0127 family)